MMRAVSDALDLIPGWLWAAALAATSLTAVVTQLELSSVEASLSAEVAARATDRAERATLALAHFTDVKNIEIKHAAEQQQKDSDYAQTLQKLELAGTTGRADAQRLRSMLSAFTAGDRGPGETDAAAGQRARDRLQLVGALLAEGIELEAEGRAVIDRRDAEVGRLLEQIQIDRAACSAP
jgi:hypothetical protein